MRTGASIPPTRGIACGRVCVVHHRRGGDVDDVVALPAVQAEFGVARADATLPYTLTMIGFGLGSVAMGKLTDRFGIVLPVC